MFSFVDTVLGRPIIKQMRFVSYDVNMQRDFSQKKTTTPTNLGCTVNYNISLPFESNEKYISSSTHWHNETNDKDILYYKYRDMARINYRTQVFVQIVLWRLQVLNEASTLTFS